MDAKGDTHGGGGLAGVGNFMNNFLGITTATEPDPADSEDDLRLDDFIGVSEVAENDNDNLTTTTTSSSTRRRRKLRKKKQASPLIIVEGREKMEKEEEEEMEDVEKGKEVVILTGSGSEEGDMELSEEGEQMKTNGDSNAEMDFNVLKVVSSDLDLHINKQKVSLCKKSSLAHRKRPTRHTVTLPAGPSDSLFRDRSDDPPVTVRDEPDAADDKCLDEEANTGSHKVPIFLKDLTQSKLFNQERKANEKPPTTTTRSSSFRIPTPGEATRPWQSSGNQSNPDISGKETSAPPWAESQSESTFGSTPENDGKPASWLESQYKQPVWLSEMKTRAPLSSGGSGAPHGLRQKEEKQQSAALKSRVSKDNVAPAVEGSRREGFKRRGVSPGMDVMKREEQQETEKPAWTRAAMEKTSRVAGRLQGQKDNQENRKEEDDDDNRAAPPWAADLKRKNCPLAAAGNTSETHQRAETPSRHTTEAKAAEREAYSPSWVKRGQQGDTIAPSSRDSGRLKTTNGSPADVRGQRGNPVQAQGNPSWQAELAEKKKRREMMSSDGKSQTGNGRDSPTAADSSSSSSSFSPSPWGQKLLRKPSMPVTSRERQARKGGEGGEGGDSPSPDWMRQVEERRARLLKAGLIEEAETESHC